MAEIEKLRNMIDSLIDDNGQKAETDFHDYTKEKIKELLQGTEDLDSNTEQNKNDK